MPMTAYTTDVDEMLEKFARVKGKSVPDLVRANARLVCVELANHTQAFTGSPSAGPAVLEKQTKTVSFDIKKVVKDTDTQRDFFNKAIKDDRLRERLVMVLNSGRLDILAKIMVNCGLLNSESDLMRISGDGEAKSAHTQHIKQSTGRTYKPPGKLYLTTTTLDGYIKSVAERIGYAKGGWAGCARAIGGVSGDKARGIPAYAKRHQGLNFEVQDRSSNTDEPYFEMTNTTKYVRRLLDKGEEASALNNVKMKLIKQMNRVFDAASKNGVNIDEITKQETEATA